MEQVRRGQDKPNNQAWAKSVRKLPPVNAKSVAGWWRLAKMALKDGSLDLTRIVLLKISPDIPRKPGEALRRIRQSFLTSAWHFVSRNHSDDQTRH
jgi:hypothetical protein